MMSNISPEKYNIFDKPDLFEKKNCLQNTIILTGERKNPIYYSVRSCWKPKCLSKYVQNSIYDKALIWMNFKFTCTTCIWYIWFNLEMTFTSLPWDCPHVVKIYRELNPDIPIHSLSRFLYATAADSKYEADVQV